MKPYSVKRELKGIAGRRKSEATGRRDRCLRADKKAARQQAKRGL